MSGITTGLIVAGGLTAAGGLGAAAMESSAAGNAADTQAQAAEYAANLQAELGQEQLGYQGAQYNNSLALEKPWLEGGANSLATLQYLLGLGNPNGTQGNGLQMGPGTNLSIPGVNGSVNIPGVAGLTGTADTKLGAFGSLMGAYPGGEFKAPTMGEAEQDPGYKFALDQGERAVQSSAAANGSLLTGGTLNAENAYAQGLAGTTYNNVYNRALQTYNTNYNTWSNQQANEYNRLASLAGLGQVTAGHLSNVGMNSADAVSQILGRTGAEIGQQMNNAAAATASGYIGSANAWGGALNGLGGNLGQMYLLYSLLNGGMGGNPATYGAMNDVAGMGV
jgi:hypothetical protein